MAKFADLDELLDDRLPLPVGGKTYHVPAADAVLGLWCQRMIEAGVMIMNGQTPDEGMPPLELDDEEENGLYRRLLGPVYDQLVTDKVSWPKIQMVAQTTLLWVGSGVAAAEAFWASGGDPNQSAPSRAVRRSTAMAGATTTRRRGSSSGTRSQATRSAGSRAKP